MSESYLGAGSQWSPDEAGVEPLPDNFLMNGQHTYDCAVVSSTFSSTAYDNNAGACTGGQLYSTSVRPNSSVRLRLINHSSFMSFWFSIDNHTMAVVEIDGIEVEPIPSRGVYVNIGQRYSVIVDANQTSGNYYMRATLPQTCFTPFCPYTSTGLVSIDYQAKGVLSYEGVSIKDEPIGFAGNTSNPYGIDTNLVRGDVWEGCDDMPFDMPIPVRKEAAIDVSPKNQHSVLFQFRQAGEVNRIFINRVSLVATGNIPTGTRRADTHVIRICRPRGVRIVTMRRYGKLWTRTSRWARAVLITAGISGSTSRCSSSLMPTKGCRLSSIALTLWNIPSTCSTYIPLFTPAALQSLTSQQW